MSSAKLTNLNIDKSNIYKKEKPAISQWSLLTTAKKFRQIYDQICDGSFFLKINFLFKNI